MIFRPCLREADAFFRRSGKSIVLFTVREILEDHLAKKLAECNDLPHPTLPGEGQDEDGRQSTNSESFFKRSHKVIVALTVQEILDEHIAKQLA